MNRLQLRQKGLENAPGGQILGLRRTFKKSQCVLIPDFLEKTSLQKIQKYLKRARFYDRVHKDIALESCMRPNTASELLNFMVNDPALFRTVRKITGSKPIGCFVGRIYKLGRSGPYYDSWHGDLVKGRLLALSINLGVRPYGGGFLEIKDKRLRRLISRTKNAKPGDAIIFRIAPHLRHRVTPVRGKNPRMVYAGWFRSDPDFMTILRQKKAFDA